jgi:hypothetical protein
VEEKKTKKQKKAKGRNKPTSWMRWVTAVLCHKKWKSEKATYRITVLRPTFFWNRPTGFFFPVPNFFNNKNYCFTTLIPCKN